MTISGQCGTEHCADIAHPYVQKTHWSSFFRCGPERSCQGWAPLERSFGDAAGSFIPNGPGWLLSCLPSEWFDVSLDRTGGKQREPKGSACFLPLTHTAASYPRSPEKAAQERHSAIDDIDLIRRCRRLTSDLITVNSAVHQRGIVLSYNLTRSLLEFGAFGHATWH